MLQRVNLSASLQIHGVHTIRRGLHPRHRTPRAFGKTPKEASVCQTPELSPSPVMG